ncbi:hypothetical protein THIX_20339 [Thiomonas sp. X19]|uniref:hypothetical protein n=1 Tax=Thiomonas sp. X19 TaxID=1050370 RepID=UPI000B693927|nr:hypothetical protein [Thiomonas sp. X19]SCC92289.1 hypothetical protein THIX_20339 [Thiomonas sp. X19]
MFTVIETLLFQEQWPLYRSEEERGEFAAHLPQHPNAGDVAPESGGIRKIRWLVQVQENLAVCASSISHARPRRKWCFRLSMRRARPTTSPAPN